MGDRAAPPLIGAVARVLIDVRPSGGQYLTTPHSDSALVVHAFPSGRVLARIESESVFRADDYFDFQAGYVTDDLILAGSLEGQVHVLFVADTLEPVGRVEYPGGSAKHGIVPTGNGTWPTTDGEGAFQVWRLAVDG